MTPQRTVVVAVADLHTGSPFALCPARWQLPTGKWLHPNPLQEQILAHWCACWQRVAALRKGARLVVLVVGDVVEGLHHETTDIETSRIDVQEAMSVACIESGLTLAHFGQRRNLSDTIYFVRGTPAHDGNGGASIERVARAVLCRDPQDSRSYVSDTLQRTVNGVALWVIHKPGSSPGSRVQTAGNAFQAWLKSLYLAGLETGSYPRYLFSAHFHTYMRRPVYSLTGNVEVVTGFILPSWKCKDSHGATAAPFALESIGMVVLDVDTDGSVREYDWRMTLDREPVQEL